MEELTEVITAAECHPHQCNVFVYSSSKGTIRLCDMRAAALCDRHSKCKYFYRIVVRPSVCLENREFESAAISEINLSLTICLVFFFFSKMHLLPVNLISLSWSVIQLRAHKDSFKNLRISPFTLSFLSLWGTRGSQQPILFLWDHLLHLRREVQSQRTLYDDTWLPLRQSLGPQHGEQASGDISGA